MSTSNLKVLDITNVAPHYRKSIWRKLLGLKNFDYHLVFGKNPHDGITTIDFDSSLFSGTEDNTHRIKNFYLKKKYLIWQHGALSKSIDSKVKVVILLGEFQLISNWLITIICRILKKKVYHKGHGFYGNETGLKLFLRKNFYKLASGQIVYERRSKNIMIQHGIDADKVHLIFNSLDYDLHKSFRPKINQLNKSLIFSFFKEPLIPTLLFIGRLTKVKKIKMLIEAGSELHKKKFKVNILIVGDGARADFLKNMAAKELPQGYFHFYGASYSEEDNAKLISMSDMCVSPGNVGLTAIHCLSYGTPVCTHNNHINQMPEVEAIEKGHNGIFFKENDLQDLISQLVLWFESKNNREEIRKNCFEVIDNYYNPYYQVEVVENILSGGKPKI